MLFVALLKNKGCTLKVYNIDCVGYFHGPCQQHNSHGYIYNRQRLRRYCIAYLQERPFVVNTTVTGQPIPLSGYCIDLLEQLSEDLGFNYNVYVVEDGNYGTFSYAENKWNGIVQDIVINVRKSSQ